MAKTASKKRKVVVESIGEAHITCFFQQHHHLSYQLPKEK